MFSLSAPTQPTNDRTNTTTPSSMMMIVKSKTTSNTSEYLDCNVFTSTPSVNRFFSENAQHPTPTSNNPANYDTYNGRTT